MTVEKLSRYFSESSRTRTLYYRLGRGKKASQGLIDRRREELPLRLRTDNDMTRGDIHGNVEDVGLPLAEVVSKKLFVIRQQPLVRDNDEDASCREFNFYSAFYCHATLSLSPLVFSSFSPGAPCVSFSQRIVLFAVPSGVLLICRVQTGLLELGAFYIAIPHREVSPVYITNILHVVFQVPGTNNFDSPVVSQRMGAWSAPVFLDIISCRSRRSFQTTCRSQPQYPQRRLRGNQPGPQTAFVEHPQLRRRVCRALWL